MRLGHVWHKLLSSKWECQKEIAPYKICTVFKWASLRNKFISGRKLYILQTSFVKPEIHCVSPPNSLEGFCQKDNWISVTAQAAPTLAFSFRPTSIPRHYLRKLRKTTHARTAAWFKAANLRKSLLSCCSCNKNLLFFCVCARAFLGRKSGKRKAGLERKAAAAVLTFFTENARAGVEIRGKGNYKGE